MHFYKQKRIMLFTIIYFLFFLKPGFTNNLTNNIILGKEITVVSKILEEERKIYISLPHDYEVSDDKYPVIYMLDGEKERFLGAVASIRYLEFLEKIPPMILVAIPNTNRSRDIFPETIKFRSGRMAHGQADNFIHFIENELIHHIEKNYRVHPYRILYGTSNSALTVLYNFVKYPYIFNGYIASSATLFWDKLNTLTEENYKNWSKQKVFLYLVCGENDLGNIVQKNKDYFNSLQSLNSPNTEINLKILPGKGHVPRTSLFNGLSVLYKQWPLTNTKEIEIVKNHYKILTEKFGYFIPVPENILNQLGYHNLRSGKTDVAIKIFNLMINLYPESANAHDSLAEAYMKNGNTSSAIEFYNKSLKLNPENSNAKEMLKKLHETH